MIAVIIFISFSLITVSPVEGQRPVKIPKVGVLLSTPTVEQYVNSLRGGLRELGYVEGKNIILHSRHGMGNVELFPQLAAELIGLNVDLIVTGSTPASLAVKNATNTIPIVMAAVADPLAAGLVVSLARPGGNVTGLSMRTSELSGKRLQLLKEVVPDLRQVAFVWNPANSSNRAAWAETREVARVLDIKLQSVEMQKLSDLDTGFYLLSKNRVDALSVIRDPFVRTQSGPILQFAMKARLPAIYEAREIVMTGGLMSYSTDLLELYRRAATYVHKILKGARPADLPIERTTRAELIVNLNAAKDIGLSIPPEVLQRADKVLQ
jgi:putative tryptophan/tyrosine transport system substrate-binding protein